MSSHDDLNEYQAIADAEKYHVFIVIFQMVAFPSGDEFLPSYVGLQDPSLENSCVNNLL